MTQDYMMYLIPGYLGFFIYDGAARVTKCRLSFLIGATK